MYLCRDMEMMSKARYVSVSLGDGGSRRQKMTKTMSGRRTDGFFWRENAPARLNGWSSKNSISPVSQIEVVAREKQLLGAPLSFQVLSAMKVRQAANYTIAISHSHFIVAFFKQAVWEESCALELPVTIGERLTTSKEDGN